jgi:hypothetical protein
VGARPRMHGLVLGFQMVGPPRGRVNGVVSRSADC